MQGMIDAKKVKQSNISAYFPHIFSEEIKKSDLDDSANDMLKVIMKLDMLDFPLQQEIIEQDGSIVLDNPLLSESFVYPAFLLSKYSKIIKQQFS